MSPILGTLAERSIEPPLTVPAPPATLSRRWRSRQQQIILRTGDHKPRPDYGDIGLDWLSGGAVDLYSGNGALALALQHHHIPVLLITDIELNKLKALHILLPDAVAISDVRSADYCELLGHKRVKIISASLPRQPVAANGLGLGPTDQRVPLTTAELWRAASATVPKIVVIECGNWMAGCQGGEGLDGRMPTPPRAEAPLDGRVQLQQKLLAH